MKVYKFLSARWAKEAIISEKLKVSILQNLNDPWDCNGIRFSNNTDRNRWTMEFNYLAQQWGMMSFSKSWTDPVLWSHYADQHRGIVLGFETSDETLFSVKYQDDLIPYDKFKLLNDDDKTNFFFGVISTKYTNWKYEDEVRVFTSLEVNDEKSNHFFRKFDEDLLLREVIFGARYQNSEEMALILGHLRNHSKIKCWKASLGNQKFTLSQDKHWKYNTR